MYTRSIDEVLIDIQRMMYESTGYRNDVHYREGYGALVVVSGYPLTPHHVITTVSEYEIAVMRR